MKERIKIFEVGPRDGLQNETAVLPATIRISLIERLANAGLRYIEAGSFVSPRRVPQMADTAAVLNGLTRRHGTVYAALVPNLQGMEAAIEAKADEVAVFAAASESFSLKNLNCSIAESLARFAPVMQAAKEAGMNVRGYVSCVAGCPYEDAVPESAVASVAEKLYAMGCHEISLGDTIGTGTPAGIRRVIKAASAVIPVQALALHCHDTYGQAMANIYAGLEEGIRTVDSSVAGLGGCPYAPGASGNVATEDVLYLMEREGFETGADLGATVETAWFIAEALSQAPRSKLAHALRKPSRESCHA